MDEKLYYPGILVRPLTEFFLPSRLSCHPELAIQKMGNVWNPFPTDGRLFHDRTVYLLGIDFLDQTLPTMTMNRLAAQEVGSSKQQCGKPWVVSESLPDA